MSDQTMTEAVREYEAHTQGTQEWHAHWGGLIYTDGIRFLADTCACWWLVDVVASHQPEVRRMMAKHGLRPFQVWRLHHDGKGEWTIDAWSDTPEYKGGEDGPPSTLLARQVIGYSSFPEALSPFEFWVEDATALLKGEH